MTEFSPTEEQQAVIDAFGSGDHLVVEAGAGTGKTSTLRMLGEAAPQRRGVYIAYNRSIAEEARTKFPDNVQCRTAHSLAFAAVGRHYKHRLNGPRVPAQQTARILHINDPVKIGETWLSPQQLAQITMDTVKRWCYSDATAVETRHVPRINGLDWHGQRELAGHLAPIAQRAWDEDLTQEHGKLRFEHDHYLKLWALSRPQLPADFVLLDEAQDSNGCVAGLVSDQQTQRIWVGDRAQSIYGWRGAVNAMETAPGKRLYLSQSFRFGHTVAQEANKWLSLLETPLRLSGSDHIASVVGPLEGPPAAILCRRNSTAVAQIVAQTTAGRAVALAGGGDEIRRFARAAGELKAGMGTSHPDLMAFSRWSEVQQYVKDDESAGDLRVMVDLVDTHTPKGVLRIVDSLVDERDAEVVVSTAHKAKGREWASVRIAGDFTEPKPDDDGNVSVARDEVMLAYVAVTRAQVALDRGALSWVDRYTPPLPEPEDEGIDSAVAVDDDYVVGPGPEPEPCLPPPEHPQPAAPGLLDDAGDGYTVGCCRCLEHYTQCTCRLMPDRRRPAEVPQYLHRRVDALETSGGARW